MVAGEQFIFGQIGCSDFLPLVHRPIVLDRNREIRKKYIHFAPLITEAIIGFEHTAAVKINRLFRERGCRKTLWTSAALCAACYRGAPFVPLFA